MPRRVFLLGLSGVGKGAIVKIASQKLSRKYAYLVVGDLVKEVGSKLSGVSGRDEVRRESNTKLYLEIQSHVLEKVKSLLDERDFIIDTHALIETQSGYLPGLPKTFLDVVRPDLFIFIRADPQQILKRRAADRVGIGRDRDNVPQGEVDQLQSMSEVMVASYSLHSGAPFRIVSNQEGQLELAAQVVKDAIEALG